MDYGTQKDVRQNMQMQADRIDSIDELVFLVSTMIDKWRENKGYRNEVSLTIADKIEELVSLQKGGR